MADASEQIMERYGAQRALASSDDDKPDEDAAKNESFQVLNKIRDALSNIDALWSSSTPKVIPADKPTSYPSSADAAFARTSGIGYGSPNEAFIQGNRERVAPKMRGDIDDQFASALQKVNSSNVPPKEKERMADIYTKAQLVVNRSPISALGFDPRHIAIDTSGDQLTLGGVYLSKSDQVWAGISESDSIVHEATHRGLQKLRDSGLLSDEESKWLKTGSREELLVRYLMEKYAGTETPKPDEKIPEEEVGRILNQRAGIYSKDDLADFNKMEASIEAKAQTLYYNLYGKGPH